MNRRARWALLTVAFVTVAGASGVVARQAQAARDQDVLQALLVEVRGLRTAIERMVSVGPRVQLALGRLQLQEQRVNTLLRRHDELTQNIESDQAQVARMTDGLSRLEDEQRRVTDTARRDDLEAEMKSVKAMVAQTNAQLQRLQAEEATLAAQIATEQGRWMDISSQLDALERTLQK
jgi:chromosome segregation ATPase